MQFFKAKVKENRDQLVTFKREPHRFVKGKQCPECYQYFGGKNDDCICSKGTVNIGQLNLEPLFALGAKYMAECKGDSASWELPTGRIVSTILALKWAIAKLNRISQKG